MKILVVTGSPWRDDNNIGNSYSNLFSNMDVEIANLYLKKGAPKNNIVKKYFQITEKDLINNFIDNKFPPGKEFTNKDLNDCTSKESNIYNKARILRWQIFFWIRELIWKFGNWKSDELKEFIDEFNPDIIFAPLQTGIYFNNILDFIKKYSNKPMIAYAWDDIYTLKQFSFSLLFWIDRIIQRKKIKKTVSLCEHLYVISEKQKYEYEKDLKIECRLLWKGYDFKKSFSKKSKQENNSPLKLLYTGNISHGRWKTLAYIGSVLNNLNKDKTIAQLYVYTLSPITSKIRKKLDIDNSVFFMGAASSKEIAKLQDEADILIHVEAFSLKERLITRLSFSTKLVDYFYRNKCIFAVGKNSTASIDYLKKNNAAIVANSKKDISRKLKEIVINKELIQEYEKRSWECGKLNHQIDDIQYKLYNDLDCLVKEVKNESITY